MKAAKTILEMIGLALFLSAMVGLVYIVGELR